jgi:hypothetical protein
LVFVVVGFLALVLLVLVHTVCIINQEILRVLNGVKRLHIANHDVLAKIALKNGEEISPFWPSCAGNVTCPF